MSRYTGTHDFSGADGFTHKAGSVDNSAISSSAGIARSKMELDSLQKFGIPVHLFKKAASLLELPTAGNGTDLGLVAGTHGTNTPTLQSSDAKATTISETARILWQLPPEYEADTNVRIRIHAGMLTTVSDDTATVDVSVYESDGDSTDDGNGDLVTDAAQDINNLSFSDKDFNLTDTNLAPGDWLDILITIAITDAATGTAVTGAFGSVWLLADIRG